MKSIHFFAVASMVFLGLMACKTTKKLNYTARSCDQIVVDFERGTLNGLNGAASMDEVKKQLPCSTGETEEGSSFNCGGGVFFLKHTFFFYTGRDYIEIREGFTGKCSEDLLGKSFGKLGDSFSKPDQKKEHESSFTGKTTNYYEFGKKWGTILVVVEEGIVKEVAMYYGQKPGSLEYCL